MLIDRAQVVPTPKIQGAYICPSFYLVEVGLNRRKIILVICVRSERGNWVLWRYRCWHDSHDIHLRLLSRSGDALVLVCLKQRNQWLQFHLSVKQRILPIAYLTLQPADISLHRSHFALEVWHKINALFLRRGTINLLDLKADVPAGVTEQPSAMAFRFCFD